MRRLDTGSAFELAGIESVSRAVFGESGRYRGSTRRGIGDRRLSGSADRRIRHRVAETLGGSVCFLILLDLKTPG